MKNRREVVNRIEAVRKAKVNTKTADRFFFGFGLQSIIIGVTSAAGLEWGVELIIIGLLSLVIYFWKDILEFMSISKC